MAHNVEPMDIDNIESDFDNKENSIHLNNVYPRTPCTEKGYEELDVSELNMKLRYSVTPASSPMSKSYTANCVDNKNQESSDDHFNSNLTRSFNAASSKGDVNKSLKSLPLQPISADYFQDNSRNAPVLRSLDTIIVADTRNVTITVNDNEKYETFELPSSSSSAAQTPEVTTPTKEMPRINGGSPIMRGLQTVLNMFRSSQSPIPLADSGDGAVKQMLSPGDATPEFDSSLQLAQSALASTPIAAYKNKESTSHRNSPHKDSIVFNEDLEKELLWKDETTILFSQEKIPIHKLFYPQPLPNNAGPTKSSEAELVNHDYNLNSTVEYMDISYNDSIIKDKSEVSINVGESDGEFLDCETTFTDDKTQTVHVRETINEATPENKKVSQEDTTHLPPLLQQTLSVANTNNFISEDSIDENNLKADKTTTLVTEKPKRLSLKTDEANLVSNIPALDTNLNIMTDNKEMLLQTDSEKIVVEEQIVLSKPSNEVTGYSLVNPNVYVPNNTIEDCSLLPQSVHDSFVVSKQSDSTENTTESITSENHSIVSKAVNRPVDSKSELIEHTLPTENVVSPPLITTAENDSKFVIEFNDPVISVHDDNDLPVNVPLPDEDDFDTVKPIYSTNTCADFNSINNYTIDTKLQSAEHNIVIVPIETIDQAKSLNLYNSNNSNKDVDVASMAIINIMIQDHERSSEKSSICDKNMYNDVEPDHNLTLDIITDIDNIISDAQLFVNDKQHKLVSNSLDQKLNDNCKTKKNKDNIEQSLTSIRCQNSENKQNEAGVDALQQQSPVLSIEIDNMSIGTSILELQHEEKCNEVVEHYSQPLYGDNKFDSFQPDSNKPNTEQSLTSMECQRPKNHQNEAGVDALQQSPVLSIEIDNMSIRESILELQHEEKCNEEVEHYSPPLSGDNKFDSCQPDFNKLDTEQSLPSIECQLLENQQNEAYPNLLQIQPKVLCEEISNEYMQHDVKCNEVVEHNLFPLSDDYKLDSFQPDFNKLNTDKILTTMECQLLENKQNEVYPNPIQIQSKVHCEKNCNEYMQHDRKCNEVIDHNLQPLSGDTKYNMIVDCDKETKLDVDIKLIKDALTNSISTTSAVNHISPIKQNVVEINSETKLELLSDVVLPIEALDAPDEMTLDNVINKLEVAREKDQIYNSKEMVSVETNEKPIINKDEIEDNIDEEIILSENNSPYMSIAGDINTVEKQAIALENVDDPFVSKTNVGVSPPISPKIVSKGYNFNFDEIDDPFATKTKIRLSPPLDAPKGNFIDPVEDKYPQRDINNRRKSQPNRKKSVVPKKAINKTFSGPVNVVQQENLKHLNTDTHQSSHTISKSDTNVTQESNLCPGDESEVLVKPTHVIDPVSSSVTITFASDIDAQSEDAQSESIKDLHDSIAKYTPDHNATVSINNKVFASDDITLANENKMSLDLLINSNEVKQTSSSEQSAYYSAATSSAESLNNRNVFNIPEIDDMNFNPFITKSRVRQSPPLSKDDSFNLNFNKSSEANKTSDTYEDKECANVSNITCSSKTTDEKDITVREVHTEDEDTVEGPFLEAEDLNNVDKISDFDSEDVDMMQFSELPVQSNNENLEDGEMFIDADAFEFLLNQNKTNVVADSGKESLFLKFDPLFAKRVSTDGVLAALKNVQKRQSTPKKTSVAQQLDTTFEKPIDGPSTLNAAVETNTNVTVEDRAEELNVTVSKPMMVVTPAVNPTVTPRNKSTTPTSLNRRSITFTSPAIAVIDRLLSLSSNNNLLGHDTTVTQVSREQNEADVALTQLRELLAEKEINVYNLRSESKELKNRLTSLESQMKTLESESEEHLRKINELNETLSEKTKLNKSMAAVVEEYERTIASLIAETEQDKKRNNEERMKLIKERDEQTAHLASMEVSFSDLHSKYEKSKQIILTCKANEDAYKKSIKDFEDNLSKMQSNYELLKQHANSKLNHANQELEKMNRAHEAEVLKLNAMIKRKDLHITSLEETLAQKTKANEELTAICDELINKVG